MEHLPPMIYDLAIILTAAAISTIIFRRLKQPIVLGYLIAGFIVSPYFPWAPTVVDKEGVHLWAEIGVIFLLFGLGLEFSFKKLAKVGRSASIAAIFELVTMSAVGYLLGRALGWPSMDSVYLGAILAMSSTTIIIRAFEETGSKGKGFANLVFGILIVEDLMAILLMVVLTAISVPGNFSGSNLLYLSGRLGFFLLIWFLIGIYVLPTALKRIRQYLTNEIMLVISIGLCLLMVVVATKTGFSSALGAFIMGSILAETEEGEKIEHLLLPVKDLFAAVFFVSVGMMIDPKILKDYFVPVVIITIITIVGKLIGSGLGAFLSGRSLKHSVQAGMSLAQIGEFSFIIATLGMSLKATSEFLYPIVIAVSAVTTFTTPYLIKYSGPIYYWIERRLPDQFLRRLQNYEMAMSAPAKEGALGLLWRVYGLAALLNSVVVIAIGLLGGHVIMPALVEAFGDHIALRFSACVVALLVCSPFLVAITLKVPKKLSSEDTANLARLRRLQLGVLIMRVLLGISLISMVVQQFSRTSTVPLIFLIGAPILIYSLRKYIEPFYTAVEHRFLSNLNAKDLAAVEKIEERPQLAPWDATLSSFVLSSDSKIAGKTIEDSKFRTMTGATIAMIDRGRKRIFAPKRTELLLPNDRLFIIGTDEQLEAAQSFIEAEHVDTPREQDELFGLESITLEEGSIFANKTIRDCGIGEHLNGLIVGVEHDGKRILNPESTVVLHPGDLVWVFGHRSAINELKLKKAEG